MEEKKKPTNDAKGGLPHKGSNIISQLAHKAIAAGYRVVPAKNGKPLGTFGQGETYALDDARWQMATEVGLVLDRALLLDYDGYKDCELTLEEMRLSAGLDILPIPTQAREEEQSYHYMFRLPNDVVPGQDGYKHSADGGMGKGIDIKCGNQIMYLKPGKTLREIKPVDQLPLAPKALVSYLHGSSSYISKDQAWQNLLQGSTVHASQLALQKALIEEGKPLDAVLEALIAAREAVVAARGEARGAVFDQTLKSSLSRDIEKYSPVAKYGFTEEIPEANWWDDWVYITHVDKFKRLSGNALISTRGFDAEYASLNLMHNGKSINPSKFALKVAQIPVVTYFMYAPSFGPFFTYDHEPCVNTYRPHTVPKAASSWPSIYQEHIELLFGEDARLLIQWMAWVATHPGKKVLWAPLLIGIEGTGKTLIINMLRAALGPANTKMVRPDAVKGSFTGWAAGACLGIIEEVKESNDKKERSQFMEKLKEHITNNVVSVEYKGKESFDVICTMNYILTSNHDDALILTDTSRRIGVFECKVKPTIEHFNELLPAIDDAEAVRGWLESVDLTDFDHRHAPPMNAARQKMIANNMGSYAAMLDEVLDTGANGVCRTAFATKAAREIARSEDIGDLSGSKIKWAAKELGFVPWPTTLTVPGGRGTTRGYCTPELAENFDSKVVRDLIWHTI